MSVGVPMVGDAYPTDFARLQANIRDELTAQFGMRRIDLDDAALDNLAEMIAVNIDYAFAFYWAPRWVKNRQPYR